MAKKNVKRDVIKVDNKEISAKDQLKYFNYVIEKQLEGRSKSEIIDGLMTNNQLNEKQANVIFLEGIRYYEERSLEDEELQNVVTHHVMIYEEIILFAEKTGQIKLKLAAMEAKEKLLGFHSSEVVLELNQQNNIVINDQLYDTHYLTQEELNSFNTLMKKIQTSNEA